MKRTLPFWLLLIVSACATTQAPGVAPSSAPAQAEATPEAQPPLIDTTLPWLNTLVGEVGEEEEDETEEEDADDAESEQHELVAGGSERPRYTSDLTDEEISKRLREAPHTLGSISMGFVDAGRLMNGVPFPSAEEWHVVNPAKAWGTQETIQFVQAAIKRVRAQFPDAPALRINQLSGREGGLLKPHKSHQNGRDVDLAFYYPNGQHVRAQAREKYLDPALNWALVKALITETDVQFILVDRRIMKVLYQYAVSHGEDPSWVDSLFAKKDGVIRHARNHRDHFHVRFYNPRAQELGRRMVPLVAQRPESSITFHQVRRGDTLARVATRYHSSARAIRGANEISNKLTVGTMLIVPLLRPCKKCPVPRPMVVPPRRLPPAAGSLISAQR